MADIFISYAREDLRWASNLTRALKAYGWSTWWDPEIPPGKEYDKIIEEELSAARCVIVGWSEQSIESTWVKDEAREAKEQDKLIPVLIEGIKAPLGFRSLQNIDLTSWDGTINSPKLEGLVKRLEEILGSALNPHVPQEEYRQTQEFFTRLLDYDTGQITVILRLIRKYDDIVDMYLFRANRQACRFFDIPSDCSETPGSDLADKIRSWVNADDFEALNEDQTRIWKNLILGKECLASIPVRFNNHHPHAEFRNQSFMPIIVAFSGRFEIEDHVEELLAIAYLNLSILCKSL
jgi:hypothetical protein